MSLKQKLVIGAALLAAGVTAFLIPAAQAGILIR